jgi:hypothetical protein
MRDELPPLYSTARRVYETHDGRPVGYTEPLPEDFKYRKRPAAFVLSYGAQSIEKARRGGAVAKRRHHGVAKTVAATVARSKRGKA